MNSAKETWTAPVVVPTIPLPPKVKHAKAFTEYCPFCGLMHRTRTELQDCRREWQDD